MVKVTMTCEIELGDDLTENAQTVFEALQRGFTIVSINARHVSMVCGGDGTGLAVRSVVADLPAPSRPANLVHPDDAPPQQAPDTIEAKRARQAAYMREYYARKRRGGAPPSKGRNGTAPAARNGAVGTLMPTLTGCQICSRRMQPNALRRCETCTKNVCGNCSKENFQQNHNPWIECRRCEERA